MKPHKSRHSRKPKSKKVHDTEKEDDKTPLNLEESKAHAVKAAREWGDNVYYWLDFIFCTGIFGIGLANTFLPYQSPLIHLPIVILVFMLKFTIYKPNTPPPEYLTQHALGNVINSCFEYVQKLLRKFSKHMMINALVEMIRDRLGLQKMSKDPLIRKISKKVKSIINIFDKVWVFPFLTFVNNLKYASGYWYTTAALSLFLSFVQILCPEGDENSNFFSGCKYFNHAIVKWPSIANKVTNLYGLIHWPEDFGHIKLAHICPKEITLITLIESKNKR